MPSGGARRGAGAKKGVKRHATIRKEEARELLRQRVLRDMEPMVAAQVSNAIGIHFLVVREKATGKFLRVGKGRAEKLDPEHEIIEIWEKDPSVQAFTDLMNRAIDKPAEQVKVMGEDGGPVEHVFRWQK